MQWVLLMPALIGINPINIPMKRTNNPINPVNKKTRAEIKTKEKTHKFL